jgi:hypothetical protein
MEVFLASLLLFGIAVLAMSLGVMLGRPPLRGTCGGIGQFSGTGCAQCRSGCNAGAGAGETDAKHADPLACAEASPREVA